MTAADCSMVAGASVPLATNRHFTRWRDASSANPVVTAVAAVETKWAIERSPIYEKPLDESSGAF